LGGAAGGKGGAGAVIRFVPRVVFSTLGLSGAAEMRRVEVICDECLNQIWYGVFVKDVLDAPFWLTKDNSKWDFCSEECRESWKGPRR